ncbi:MBG domain-containing protein [Luteolibacter luteus]|uniref:S8 family serine peptidase n=1 Tax=Luteolibacter luteus TaxID=2728835 RepID=A0A858RCC4_9BACT|nr:MBG domain-containing protein [Luteolibacter luteus]QJE94254.1 S8 family serine peptidase [Luteolibacter luteus]
MKSCSPFAGRSFRFAVVLWCFARAFAAEPASLAQMLAQPNGNLRDDASRARIATAVRGAQSQRLAEARQRAAERKLPLRIQRPNGVLQEIEGFEGDEPRYRSTHNANAAISTAANLTRTAFAVDGDGLTIGLWDGGSARATHQEFGGRVVAMDGAASVDHATHVAGTLAAAGVVANAKGMAPAITVDSYDWNNDVSEMTSRGASAPGQEGKIYLSNHSYGFISGWNYVDDGIRVWEWNGNGTTSTGTEQDFGRYSTYARDQDALAFAAPYYSIFRSAGNERVDNPGPGENVSLAPASAQVVSYDPALHPAGDGDYHGGFETIGFESLAKNVITIGSVTDAVTGGTRDVAKANSSTFSSWGPTDDGRIKPDLVANGDALYSSLNGSNTSYGTYSGTSMATPNAAGSAALLIELYGRLFPGQAMRASTLKGLLIHSADDRGNPGPDYKFGWGLVNAKAAADLINDHSANPLRKHVTESSLGSSIASRTESIVWDGVSPIVATLCWTDPAGSSTSTSDLRTARLVNNLDLKITGPGGAEYLPYVMPFVGDWSEASMDSAATTGVNHTDNVEQVRIASPGVAGTYQVTVSFSGTLTNAAQNYSLLISGSAAEEPPLPPLSLTAVSPASGFPGTATIEVTGDGFGTGTGLKLTRSGQPDIVATDLQLLGVTSLRGQLNLTGAAPGLWNVVVTDAEESASLADAFTVVGALWSESFDGTVNGWASQAGMGGNAWMFSTAASHSPQTSYFAPAPETKSTVALVTPSIVLPANASNLQFRFWQSYNFQNAQDGGKLEFSVDGGAWFEVSSANSGLAFAANGYNATIAATGSPSLRSEFAGLPAWSGNSNGFLETVVNFTDTAKFAGHALRMRWRLATNGSIASPGWYLDSMVLIGGGDLVNQAPVVTDAADAPGTEAVTDADGSIFHIVRGASAPLTVGCTDDGGEEALTYLWSVASGPGDPVGFSANGSNAAQQSEASFHAPGDYHLSVLVTDAAGLTATSDVKVRVVQTPSDLAVSPASAVVPVGGMQAFTATLHDQFGAVLSDVSAVWSENGGGSINAAGIFTAATTGGPFVISATAAGFTATASVTVTPAAASVSISGLAQVYDGSPHAVNVTTDPAGLPVRVTYNGSLEPPVNAGSYAVEANITDPSYQGSASGVMEIAKVQADVVIGNLSQPYDGTPKTVTVTTDPAGLEVAVTYDGSSTPPSAAGSYAVAATITDPNHEGQGTAVLEITGSNFASWQAAHFTEEQVAANLAAAGEDPDHDGLANLAEYALGSDPFAFTPGPAMSLDETHLILSFERPAGITDVECIAESGSTLGGWEPVVLELISTANGRETLQVKVPRPPGPGNLFLRLRFEFH